MIIQDLTELYSVPIKGRDGMVRWVIRGKNGIEVSIVHSPRHYCNDTSAEVAYVRSGGTIEPSDATNDQYILDLFGYDTVAGWCNLENITRIVAAVQ